MTKGNVLYQVYLILDSLPEDEYNKIPKEELKFITENMEYNENIKIEPDIPLEQQDISEETYKYLDVLIKKIEDINSEDQNDNSKITNLLEKYKAENNKIPKIKELVEEYRINLKKSEEENKELKNINKQLYNSICKCPFIIRKIFFKEFDKKLLK